MLPETFGIRFLLGIENKHYLSQLCKTSQIVVHSPFILLHCQNKKEVIKML